MQAFWDDIDLMQAVTRIMLWVAAGLLCLAGVAWVLQRPYFSINQFRFVGDVQQLEANQTHALIEDSLNHGLAGGFFSMNLYQIQNSLQQLSWVKSTSIRRVWPHEIEISIAAHEPLAIWKDRYLSPQGQVFAAQLTDAQRAQLIQTEGPDEGAPLMAQQLPVLQQWLEPLGWKIKKINLSQRYSWQVTLSNDLVIELGRADTPTALEERVQRLVKSAQFVQQNVGDAGGYIDLRYPNGFAMRSEKLHRTAAATLTNTSIGEQQ